MIYDYIEDFFAHDDQNIPAEYTSEIIIPYYFIENLDNQVIGEVKTGVPILKAFQSKIGMKKGENPINIIEKYYMNIN